MTQQAFRVAGGFVDRNKPINFRFDGQTYQGFAGDTLASALLAHGVHLMGRSFKYHRPRGVLSAGAEEPNALVSVRRDGARVTPNLRATQIEIYEGLVAESQNRFPSLRFDLGAMNDWLSPFLGAGFYYKTFMHPKGAWAKLYEPLIRRAAGLGHAPVEADPDFYAQRFAHCDVLVAGGGPAGLAAAVAAGQSGAIVILVDEQSEWGGSLLADISTEMDGASAQLWIETQIAHLKSLPNVTLLSRTTVFGYFQQNFLGLVERCSDHLPIDALKGPRERLWQVRAKQVVLATGAIERPLVFPGNDRPGILLAHAARLYCNHFGVLVGRNLVVFTADDAAYQAAIDLHHSGAHIAAIADLRDDPQGPGIEKARRLKLPIMAGTFIVEALGRQRVNAVELASRSADGVIKPIGMVECDAVLMSGGFTPSVHLFSQSRGRLRFDPDRQIYLPGQSVQKERSAGGARGHFDLPTVIADGFAAGREAADQAGFISGVFHVPSILGDVPSIDGYIGDVPRLDRKARSKAFVDFQNDVKSTDIAAAIGEGFRSIEHVKRYTTGGMATDQGKTSNMNLLAIAASELGKPVPAIGLTTFRMPYTPVTFGAIAGQSRGDLFDPIRTTPLHDRAVALGAVFENVGLWKRALYIPKAGETQHDSVLREGLTVRRAAGLFDASTLGKIEVVGPDAAEFLNRIYTNPLKNLGIGRCRYGLMLNEAGFIMDDGVIGRIEADRFHVTTTTSGAARVLAHMEDYRQTEFTDLDVWLTSITEQWAVIAVQGPRARDILAPFVEGIDLSAEAMPHMSLRTGFICGIGTRLFRVSFTGELGFEVNIPSDEAAMVWGALWAEARKFDACLYGTEAMHVLRAEKGYIIVGQDTDGTVTPHDVGLDWAIGKTKIDFVGKRSLARPDLIKKDRPHFVGLLPDDPHFVPDMGAQIVTTSSPASGAPALGYVSSAYDSPVLGRSLALGFVAGGRSRMGETIYVTRLDGPAMPAKLVAPVFYDPDGERLHG
jgi:sarcosine oxidase, subunit alpha